MGRVFRRKELQVSAQRHTMSSVNSWAVRATSATNYANEMDKGMLYIACTRAMHELQLTHDGPLSRFLEFADQPRKSAIARVG